MNRRKFITLSAATCCSMFLPSCATNPVTDRKQLLIYPETFINRQSALFYKNFIRRSKISDDKKAIKLDKGIFDTSSIYNVGSFILMIILALLYSFFW